MKITKSQLKQIIKEELNEFGGVAGNLAASRMGQGAYKRDDEEEELEEEKDNPWAICTASVGREDKEKYEKCVMSVKKEKGIK
jgi:hypothetical protein